MSFAPNQLPPQPYNPARELAVRVLIKVLSSESFAAPALDSALSQAHLPARDAGLATHIVYGTLRHITALRQALALILKDETHPRTLALLLAATFEKLHLNTPTHAVVNEYVNLARRGRLAPAGLVNAVLRRVEAVTLSPAQELPDWLADSYRHAYGERAEGIFAELLTPQPLWLSLSDAGVAALEAEGSVITPGPQGVDRVELSRPLRQTAAYARGQAQPINPASLACVDALGDVAGQRVLDLAGGAGVKAAMLAARGGQVTSVDIAGYKHQAAKGNFKRLGLSGEFITHDLTQPLAIAPAPFVLLDAPCSGTGTLRSHPEIKLRITPQTVSDMAALQRQMLEQSAGLVEAGGVLVYSVCAVTRQEGPRLVDAFLTAHPEFAPEAVPDIEVPHQKTGEGILTIPEGGIDGFFMARLRKG